MNIVTERRGFGVLEGILTIGPAFFDSVPDEELEA